MRLLPVAAAVALLLPLTNVFALALGRISVQSALGEPLRAEVEVTQITPDEAASLRAAPAALEAFRAAGIERHPALAELRVSPERLANGRFIIRLSSDRVVNEPVIDLLLEASWSAGRIVRDYTLLFDPPVNRAATPATPGMEPAPAPIVAAQLPPLPPATGLAPGESTVAPGSSTGPTAAAPAASATAAPAASAPAPAPAQAASAPASTPAATRVTVRPGDTAGRLAAVAKPASVSLEQMLVALLRTNPDAFVGNNMNRLKAGAVLEMPAAETAAAVEAREARRTVIAQSQDFNEFRRRLAEATAARPEGAAPGAGPTDTGPAASRRATGQVEARVEEKGRRPADATPDRLTLSKGAVQGQAAASAAAAASSADAPRTGNADRIARQRAEQEASQRQSELDRNIAELNRLNAGVAGARPAGSAASAAGVALNLPASPASAASTPAAAASEAASAPAQAASAAPSAAASAAQAPASTPAKAASGAANARPGFADRLLAALGDRVNQPWPLAIGAAVVAGLAAIGGLLWWSRRKAAGAFPAPATTPAPAGARATGEHGDGASLSQARSAEKPISTYSASGSDTPAETDPLAEADVYIAYGRDLQAEEVLQEALRATPDRLPVIVKLLEVFARRFDWEAFEPLARRARTLTGAQGPDWARVVELGGGLAPIGHPLFSADARDASASTAGMEAPFEAGSFASAPASDPSTPSAGAAGLGRTPDAPPGLDLDIEGFRMPPPTPDTARAAAPAHDPEIDGLFEDDIGPRADNYRASPTPPGAAMDFDLAGLSLDLSKPAVDAGAAADPLATKLALAEEFLSIGDTEGARSLAEEVRAQASGDLRARAERLLAELG